MSGEKARRGRPKGSGIDDRVRLREIAALLAANPDLRPTTAIKTMGVTDPSVIRRLRDKYHQISTELMAELRPAPAVSNPNPTPPCSMIPNAVERPHRSIAASAAPPMKRTLSLARRTPPDASDRPETDTAEVRQLPARAGYTDGSLWFASWYGFGLRAASTAVETQLAMMQQVARLPYVTFGLRQQLAVGEMTLALCGGSAATDHEPH